SLSEIVGSIKKVADIVSEIANASSEQATGIDQVNTALAQMDEVTQQNSALVEQNAASAKTLEHQSTAMNEKVAFFRIDDMAEQRAAKPRTPVAASNAKPLSREMAPARQVAAAGGNRRGGPLGRMQAVATAVAEDPGWKEF
ncbi:MAG TPA: methyl-accepting chemotaxis protein, partial [Reyranella sp.]|nr:methyl-accepting chemotaxis protein [Reyranella sp.]